MLATFAEQDAPVNLEMLDQHAALH